MTRFRRLSASIVLLMLSLTVNPTVFGQNATSGSKDSHVSLNTLAVRYVEGKKTSVALKGTALAPRIMGKADVEYKNNNARIKMKLENLDSPQSYGAFYTTYVVWAVTPEGQTENLIELPGGYLAEISTATSAQTFGIIVSVEPHNAVKVPSKKVIVETSLPKNIIAGVQTKPVEFKADSGDLYVFNDNDASILKADYTTPRLVLGARRSIDIARRVGAREYAAEEFKNAQAKLAELEQIYPRNLKNELAFSGLARDVMRLGQVARDLSVEREIVSRIEDERQARIRSLEEARAQAEAARIETEKIRQEADRARLEAEKAKAEALLMERAAQDERARREQASREAEEAGRMAQAARAQELAARAESDRNLRLADDAKRERDAALQRLYVSLSDILDTKRGARGFIVNLGDVLFDTGRATLKPAAREKLSKLTGILLAYPGSLTMDIEGHTDSVGSDVLNNRLSQSRADAVRDYLVQSGVKSEKIKSSVGYGKSKPIAPNETAGGRQSNRRVELIIDDSNQTASQ